MRKIFLLNSLLLVAVGFSQGQTKDSTLAYKKRVLETTEIDFLMSYYTQNGDNASVTGGIGTEKLTDLTPTIVVSYPLNNDDVLTAEVGISAYTSASSSNLDPFDLSGASGEGDDDDDDDDDDDRRKSNEITGSPWVASSGASASDVWASFNINYSHSSDNRNNIWGVHTSVASEYDYFSIGFGGQFTKLFNEKNTEISLSGQLYLDTWRPRYPTELDSYLEVQSNLNDGFFENMDILDQNGNIIDKSGNNGPIWSPIEGFNLINDKARNSYSIALNFSQIISKSAQISLFFDFVNQNGWLANPTQRVYFGDIDNYYIGNASNIPNYTSPTNTDVFQLADDIERLPDARFKIAVGGRLNYYVNEIFSIRTYYRYYSDDWGVNSHTANIEIPIKITNKFTLYPSYRYYTQTAVYYFAPFEQNLSTQEFYTSDYDLSAYDANQYGFGISYTDIFTKMRIWNYGLKKIDIRFKQYERSTGLSASIISTAFKFILQ